MMQEKIFQNIQEALKTVHPELSEKTITTESSLIQDLMIDSLKLAELSLALEEKFQKPLSLHEVFLQATSPQEVRVQDVICHIEKKLQQTA